MILQDHSPWIGPHHLFVTLVDIPVLTNQCLVLKEASVSIYVSVTYIIVLIDYKRMGQICSRNKRYFQCGLQLCVVVLHSI